MPDMKTVDAEVISQAIAELTGMEPLFRTQEEVDRFVGALRRIAHEVGASTPWDDADPPS